MEKQIDDTMTYGRLLFMLRSGIRLPRKVIRHAVRSAGRNFEDLAMDLFADDAPSRVASGDVCPECHAGTMTVYSVRRHADRQTRYLRCDRCGHTGKQHVPATAVRRRKR